MGKKTKSEGEAQERRGRRGKASFSFLGTSFDGIDKDTVRQHIFILAAIAIVTKFAVVLFTTAGFHSFVDLFDIGFYYDHIILLLQGQLPYISYPFDYPILVFVPLTIAFIPALLFQNAMAFVYTFQFLMIVCDTVTIMCIYFIAMRIWNEKTAFRAGLIYATAFSTAYFVITKYDAFPTSLMMVALLFTVYGMNVKGYIAATLGFFAKIYPAIAFPFLIVYNAKTSSLKEEIISTAKVVVPFFVVLFLPLAVIRPEVINTYLFATGTTVGVYVNTATYTIYAWLHDVIGLGVSSSAVSIVMYCLMALVLLAALASAWFDTEKKPDRLLRLLLVAIFSVILFTKFHSPQYIVWFTPLLCLLVADDIVKIGLFFIAQALAYIEFPLMFNGFYTNLQYVNAVGSSGWYTTLLFFTFEYAVLIILMYLAIRPADFLKVLKQKIPGAFSKTE